jgi:hypothetical protein
MKNQQGLETVTSSSKVLCSESNQLNGIIGSLESEVLGNKARPLEIVEDEVAPVVAMPTRAALKSVKNF